MKTKINYFLLSFLLITIFSSCRKDLTEPKATESSIEDIAVPESFDWKTTKAYTIHFSTHVSGLVEVSNVNGIPYQRAFLIPDKTYMMNLTVPSYEKKVHVKHGSFTKEIDLLSAEIFVNF